MPDVELDLEAFWEEERACRGKAFRTDKPRCPILLSVDDHWLLEEMRLPSTVRYYREADYRASVNRQCNDRCQEALGIRPFDERPAPPPPLRIEQVFGSRIELVEGGTPWLEPGVSTIEDLQRLLDGIEAMDDAELRGLIFSGGGVVARMPPGPDGQPQRVGAGSRGPATIATSVMGTMACMYWLVDEPAVMDRFFAALAETLVRYHRILQRERNVVYRGYGWLDDNCALFPPNLYRRYCLPVLRRVFDEFCPAPADRRFQHSDSAMGHLMGILNELGFHAVNFGPTIPAQEIRRAMPRAEIQGQVAPNTLRNNGPEAVAAEVRRDFAAVGADGGLLVTTSGSISAGTSLAAIRHFMAAVQRHTRYDGR